MWQNPRSMELRARSVVIAAACSAALSLAMLAAVARNPATTVPMDAGDPVLISAVLQWNATKLRVDTSVDGATWNAVSSGPIWAAAMTGGWEDEARISALVPFTPVSARYVRLTQVGGDSGFYWSIAELEIFR